MEEPPPASPPLPRTYQVPDPVPGVVHEGEHKSKLGRVDQCWSQTQGLHKFQMRLEVPGDQQGRQAKKRDP